MGYDLFNPPVEFNLKIMSDNNILVDIDNPYIKVVWEDDPENFTAERKKSVRQYFQDKYSSKNVNVITKAKSVDNSELYVDSSDIAIDITDISYQRGIVKNYLEVRELNDMYDDIVKFDDSVNNKIIENEVEIIPFKKWIIKKIEFSNFLSYGDNQVLDFDKYDGIIAILSDPPNFGGKSVLTTDLLLFLFFNETTKSSKAADIFNRYRDKNKVVVKGHVVIDGDEYIIARTITRKESKKGDWNVSTDLEFYRVLADGTLENFTGEQRRETEKFIRESIGKKEDFLMTILTTGNNLEELIDSKPTARGHILTRFLGLDYLKKKEEIAKEFYSEFSKSLLSNVYNRTDLGTQIEEYKSLIDQTREKIEVVNEEIVELTNRIDKGQNYKDGLLNQLYVDIDNKILSTDVDDLLLKIDKLEKEKSSILEQLNSIVVDNSNVYDEEDHDAIKKTLMDLNVVYRQYKDKISEVERLVKDLSNGITCDHCGIKLMDAKLTKEKIDGLDKLKEEYSLVGEDISKLEIRNKKFTEDKKLFDEIERNKIIKDKLEISIESIELKIQAYRNQIDTYNSLQEKILKNKEIEIKLIQANELLKKLQNEMLIKRQSINNFENEIKSYNEKISKNEDMIKIILEEEIKDRVYKVYLDIFGKNGISKMIMKTMIPLINSELQRLLEDSSFFNLEIRINDKNDVEFWMVDNSTGLDKLITTGSGYERTIASLAIRSVLSKVCSLPKPNIVVFDEVFGKISNDNLDMVAEFFNKIKSYFDKILVITHNPLILNWADSQIMIKKENNISYIEN